MQTAETFRDYIPHPLMDGFAPQWADEWGQDDFGVFAEFSLRTGDGERVSQRLRWIPRGMFLMGSPDDEPGRFENEGPQHRVSIKDGFWLFDTPCTQAVWQAVMDENPSYFVDPERPVEQVTWDACQEFLRKIKEHVDVDLALPTEAQWEYACRAGTTTATYDGALEILGDCNAPGLDSVAWYSGNSGVDFDLDNGIDSAGWSQKQYDHTKAGTRKVGLKAPNEWGLYDMLGNVWEWCQNRWYAYPRQASAGQPQGEEATERVLRGGCWGGGARGARSACRGAGRPGDRYHGIGFRCALVQAKSAHSVAE